MSGAGLDISWQNGSATSGEGRGTEQPVEGEAGASTLKHSVAALLKNISLQLGSSQGEGATSTALKELLMKMGFDADEVAQLLETNGGTGTGEEKQVFLAHLMRVLEGKGIAEVQAQAIRELMIAVQVRGDRFVSADQRRVAELKAFLTEMGLDAGEADTIVKSGELSVASLKKIVAALGGTTEELSTIVEGEKVALGDLKRVLLQLGVKPEGLNGLLAQSSSTRSDLVPKGLLEALANVMTSSGNNGAAANPGEDALTSSSDSGGRDSSGGSDVNGGGQLASAVKGEKGLAGVTQTQGDFEQVMSKIVTREPVAQRVMEQIVQGARIQVARGETRARIVLEPPSLGKVNLHIITKDDQVKVTFFAENQQVKEIIESNLAQLRQSFVQQGLRVDDFGVFVGHHPSGNAAEQQKAFGGLRTGSPDRDGPEGEEQVSPGILSPSWMSGNHTVDIFV